MQRYHYPGVSADSPSRRVPVLVISSLLLAGLWLAAVTVFGEWGADWWHISIWLWGLALIAVVCVILLWAGWLRFSVRNWMIWVLVIYTMLSMGLGVYCTEASTNGGIPRSVTAQEHPGQYYDDNYRYSRGGWFYYNYIYVGGTRAPAESSGGSSSVTCTGKSCGGAALVIVLLILLLASALIPHFWVIAALCGIVLLLLALRREMLAPSEARALEGTDTWSDFSDF